MEHRGPVRVDPEAEPGAAVRAAVAEVRAPAAVRAARAAPPRRRYSTRSSLEALVSGSQPVPRTQTVSSIRMPPQPGM